MRDLVAPRIVLVSTSHPGNIGSAARAMKTMGFSELYLVTPHCFPDPKAIELAVGADDILAQASIVSSLQEALAGCHQVYATSARSRAIALMEMNPETCAGRITALPRATKVALVFGNERTGLTNEQLMLCHYQIIIPTDPQFSSLNLAQSVQIIAYEWWKKRLPSSSVSAEAEAEALASSAEIEGFYTQLHEVLVAIDFLKPSNPKKLFHRLRRLFNRTKLERTEVNILRGILTQVMRFK
jgi:tRNA (cytidine32/uridine32-2'-O)-methyltransferase